MEKQERNQQKTIANDNVDMEQLRIWDAEEMRVCDEMRALEWLKEMRGHDACLPDYDDLNYFEPDVADQFDEIDE